MLDWSGTLRSRGQCCPRGRSMPPPLDRLRLPSGSDPTVPPPVHESVSGTLLTTTGQDLSPRRDRNPSQQQEYRSHEQSQRHACNAPTSSTVQDSASHLSTSKDSQGLEASHSSSSSPAALPEVAAKSRDLLPKCDRQTRSQASLSSAAGGAFSSSRSTTASRSVEAASSSSSGAPSRPAAAASAPTPSSLVPAPSSAPRSALLPASAPSPPDTSDRLPVGPLDEREARNEKRRKAREQQQAAGPPSRPG